MINILHITAHLGGGVGKFLSGLVEQSSHYSNFKHTIICLEKSKDRQFINIINKYGNVIENPSVYEVEKLIKETDIVHLEYWNHPILIKYLCYINFPPMRLLVCNHNNGLYNPIIPNKLIIDSDKFIFTTECSYKNEEILKLVDKNKFGVVHTSGGFKEKYNTNNKDKILVGYAGSFNFAKLHPDYSEFINEIDIPDFKVKMIGNPLNRDILEKQSDRFEFTGFVPDIYSEFEKINVLAYLLNPKHYGTTENVLIEAMSVGIVPIVLNNPAESCIIENKKTGFIVNSPKEFKEVVEFLSENPIERRKIGNNAILFVRSKYSIENTIICLNEYYDKIITKEKHIIDFKSIFGNTPDEWFLSCQKNKYVYKEDGNIDLKNINKYEKYILLEESKGSVFHFSKYFPDNLKLKLWSDNLKRLL